MDPELDRRLKELERRIGDCHTMLLYLTMEMFPMDEQTILANALNNNDSLPAQPHKTGAIVNVAAKYIRKPKLPLDTAGPDGRPLGEQGTPYDPCGTNDYRI